MAEAIVAVLSLAAIITLTKATMSHLASRKQMDQVFERLSRREDHS